MSDVAARLESIRERVEAATEGPWKLWNGWGPYADDGKHRVDVVGTRESDVLKACRPDSEVKGTKADLEFIAESRSDVPYLLSLVGELREERDGWRSQAKALDLRLDGVVSEYDRLEAAVREVVGGLIRPTRFDDDMMECALCVRVAEDPKNIPHADECSVRRLSAALRDAAQEGAE